MFCCILTSQSATVTYSFSRISRCIKNFVSAVFLHNYFSRPLIGNLYFRLTLCTFQFLYRFCVNLLSLSCTVTCLVKLGTSRPTFWAIQLLFLRCQHQTTSRTPCLPLRRCPPLSSAILPQTATLRCPNVRVGDATGAQKSLARSIPWRSPTATSRDAQSPVSSVQLLHAARHQDALLCWSLCPVFHRTVPLTHHPPRSPFRNPRPSASRQRIVRLSAQVR